MGLFERRRAFRRLGSGAHTHGAAKRKLKCRRGFIRHDRAKAGPWDYLLDLAIGRVNDLISRFHHRMPVILEPDDYALWLDPAVQDSDRLQPLLHQYPPEEMMAYPVSLRVNNPANDTPDCIAPMGGVPDHEPGEAGRRPEREK